MVDHASLLSDVWPEVARRAALPACNGRKLNRLRHPKIRLGRSRRDRTDGPRCGPSWTVCVFIFFADTNVRTTPCESRS